MSLERLRPLRLVITTVSTLLLARLECQAYIPSPTRQYIKAETVTISCRSEPARVDITYLINRLVFAKSLAQRPTEVVDGYK
jgi:hypothetical protein